MSNKPDVQANFRLGMRYWASGIGIACAAHDEQYHGMTISSFTSLSIDPPRVLISLDSRTRTHELVQQSGAFAVTLLAENQQEISQVFAGALEESANRFEGIKWERTELGNPIILGGLAYFDCKIVEQFELGQQTAFIAKVVSAQINEERADNGQPLLYFNRGYHKLAD
jgi:flavin reductase (DIM6/NTAB) family NADH-FMN oxidoreductase RutF